MYVNMNTISTILPRNRPFKGKYIVYLTLPKTISLHLKIGIPKRKETSLPSIIFQRLQVC